MPAQIHSAGTASTGAETRWESVPCAPTLSKVNAADLVRTVRSRRSLSQRQLAAHAQLPPSTIDRIESGRSDPRLSTLIQILSAVHLRLVVTNQFSRVIELEEDLGLRDKAGRQPPAHLDRWIPLGPMRNDWWGWGRIAWQLDDPKVPKYTYARRGRMPRGQCYIDGRWNDAT
jgi:transcriptional regulator with XRE-family HTH domain